MAAWTTDDLVRRAKRKAQRPLRDLNYTDQEILEIADEELSTFLAPLIRTTRESYYLKSVSFPIVSGQAEYRIPSDTSAGTIREIWLQDNTDRVLKIPMVEPENRGLYLNYLNFSIPAAVCLIADQVVLLPTPSNTQPYTMVIWYEQRRSLLTLVANCAQVQALGPTETEFTTSVPPAALQPGGFCDFVESEPNFDIISHNNLIVSTIPPFFTVTDAVVAPKVVGAYICPAGYSCIVQLPDLFHFALVYATAAAMLQETADLDVANSFRAEVASRIEGLSASVEPRAVGMNPVIYNPTSPIRNNRGWGWTR